MSESARLVDFSGFLTSSAENKCVRNHHNTRFFTILGGCGKGQTTTSAIIRSALRVAPAVLPARAWAGSKKTRMMRISPCATPDCHLGLGTWDLGLGVSLFFRSALSFVPPILTAP
jgi:hypothetical protein